MIGYLSLVSVALLCNKEPAHSTQKPLTRGNSCLSLWVYGIRLASLYEIELKDLECSTLVGGGGSCHGGSCVEAQALAELRLVSVFAGMPPTHPPPPTLT